MSRQSSETKSGKNRSNTYVYHVKVDGQRVPVCKSLLLQVLQISEGRMKTILKALFSGELCVEDKRGLHKNRPHKINTDIWTMVKTHWNLFPWKTSHYGQKKTQRKYFDNPDLNVVKLYRSFQQHYFEERGESLKMRYETYHRFFRENSPYAFRKPRTDTCDFCREAETILSVNPNDQHKVLYELHNRRVMRYSSIKEEHLNSAKAEDSDTLVIEIDYAQNLPLPRLNITAQFYKRLLWLYVFNVHCHNDDSSTFYCFFETEARKDPNSVCSFLHDFLCKKLQQIASVKKIVLLSDSCGGQNKNMTVVRFCSWFSKAYDVTIRHMFPVRGHSYNKCDRNFDLYGNALKNIENIEGPEQYFNILRTCRKTPMPFEVLQSVHLIEDWSAALDFYFEKKPKAKNHQFSIQKSVILSFRPHGFSASPTYSGALQPYRIIKKSICPLVKSELKLTKLKCPAIKPAKKKDIMSLLKYLKEENAAVMKHIVENGTVNETATDNDNETVLSDSDEFYYLIFFNKLSKNDSYIMIIVETPMSV